MPPRSAAWAAALAPGVVNLGPRELLDDSATRQVPVLPGTNGEWLAGRLHGCRELELAPRTALLRRGVRSRTVYLVTHGQLEIFADGDEVTPHAVARVGEVVGELGVLTGQPATMDVRAHTAARVLAIDEDTFFCLLHESHVFALNVLLLLVSRLRTSAAVISSFAEQGRRLERVASHDPLTKLRNRRWLDDTLPACVAQARAEAGPLTVLMIDIDHFKRINDTYGHADGDLALAAVAQVLAGGLRQADPVARFGGEEFVVLLPDEDVARGAAIAERLRGAVSASSVLLRDGQVAARVTVSVGLAELHEGDDAAALLARADRALYRAKARGRNCVAVEAD